MTTMLGKRNENFTAGTKRNFGNTAVRDRIQMFEQREKVKEIKEHRQSPRRSERRELDMRADAGKNCTAMKPSNNIIPTGLVDRILRAQLPPKDNVAPPKPEYPPPKYEYLRENRPVAKTLKPPPPPPRINNLHSRSEDHLNRKFSIRLDKYDDIVRQKPSSPPAATSIATKALYVDRDRLKQQSLFELHDNLRFIEQLRDLYLEEIKSKEAKMFSTKDDLCSFDKTYNTEICEESLHGNEDHYEECFDNCESYNQSANGYSHEESDNDSNCGTVEAETCNQHLNTECDLISEYSDDSEDNVYLSLDECLSGVSLRNHEVYKSAQFLRDDDCQEETALSSDGSDEEIMQELHLEVDYDDEMKQ